MAKAKQNDWIEAKTQYTPFVNWDEVSEIVGVIAEIRYVETLQKKVMEIETSNGKVAVGESGLLKFPEELKAGYKVRVVNSGWIKTKSGRRARDLKLFYKPEPF